MRLKRNEYRLIEERIKALNDDKYHLTQEHIDEVLARAHDELLRREKARIARQEARKRRLRRVVVGSAAIVSVLVVSFVYSALAPVTVSSANNFVRRASIWINDKLRLGVTFTEPVDDEAKKVLNANTEFSSLEEAAKNLNAPIVYFEDAGTLKFDKVSATGISSFTANPPILIKYKNDSDYITLDCYPMGESDTLALGNTTDDYVPLETKLGTVYFAELENAIHGIMTYQNYMITIKTTLGKDTALPIIQTLNALN